MTEMYINTYDDLTINTVEVGDIYNCYKEGKTITCAFRIIRVASKDEYLKWLNEMKLHYMVENDIHNDIVEVLD